MIFQDDLVIPILTIRLELIDNRVAFRPPLDTHTSVISVQELVHQWLDSFLARGKLVKMLGPKVRNKSDSTRETEKLIQMF
jgi:hypothetical protein